MTEGTTSKPDIEVKSRIDEGTATGSESVKDQGPMLLNFFVCNLKIS
jgi:hypothetical protein